MEAQRERGLRALWCDYDQIPRAPLPVIEVMTLSPSFPGLHPAMWSSHSHTPLCSWSPVGCPIGALEPHKRRPLAVQRLVIPS